MNETHRSSLIRYLNDVVAMERDFENALRTQMEDDRVKAHPLLNDLFLDLAVHADQRKAMFEELVEDEGGSLGGSVKEGIAAVTGVFSGLTTMARQHPLSRMVRDSTIAMNAATVSYSMLVTLAMALHHKRCEELAISALNDCPKAVLQLTDLLPHVVVEELSDDAPVPNAMAAPQALAVTREAWNRQEI